MEKILSKQTVQIHNKKIIRAIYQDKDKYYVKYANAFHCEKGKEGFMEVIKINLSGTDHWYGK